VDIGLVICDPVTQKARWVLDTKYKAPKFTSSTDDLFQVHAYAAIKQAPEAILIYPAELQSPLDVSIGDIRVRSLPFALDGDLEAAGRRFVEAMGEMV